jgi:hypothetical protein
MLESAVEALQRLIPAAVTPISRDRAFRVSIWEIVSYPARLILDRFRSAWRFQPAELQFVLQTLQTVIGLLKRREKPEAPALVQARMDLHACEVIIERKLAGLPELRQAQRIEHFCQAPHIEALKLEEISGLETEIARRMSA